MAEAALQAAAEPAVKLLITLPLVVLQNARGSHQISKHQLFPSKELPHLRQTIFSLP